MKPQNLDARPNGWASDRPGWQSSSWRSIGMNSIELVQKTAVAAELEIRKLRHDPSDLVLRSVQPVLWLLIFGQVFTRVRAIPTDGLPYLDFMAAGILAQSVLFVAIFTGGMSIIWERDLGIVHKFLASPIPRVTLVLGKSAATGIRSLFQIIVIYGLSLLLGVNLNLNPIAVLLTVLVVLLGSACFCTFSLIIACLVQTRERFTGVGQLLTMPLFFASNAIYPISLMPGWLQVVSQINPLTYQVDALRATMLAEGSSNYGVGVDVFILLTIATVLTLICSRLYPRVAR